MSSTTTELERDHPSDHLLQLIKSRGLQNKQDSSFICQIITTPLIQGTQTARKVKYLQAESV